jgi:hypothetical protein
MTAEIEGNKTFEKEADLLGQLESPICDVRDMAALCLVALEHAGTEFVGIPESEYIKVTKDNWQTLSFALRQQEVLINELVTAYYSQDTEQVEGSVGSVVDQRKWAGA